MELTGKNKEQFEKFYADKFQQGNFYKLGWFYGLPLSMQFGVVVDYADSIGYLISFTHADGGGYDWTIWTYYEAKVEGVESTLDEARKAAIKAFDEIVNSNARKVKHKK